MSCKTYFVFVVVCGLFVGEITMATTSCADHVQCSLYAQEICTDGQYLQWASNNCAKYCHFCTDGTHAPQMGVGKFMDETSGITSTCKDAIADCAQFGTKLCTDVKFYSWVNDNCRAHCNRCADTCVDKVSNCADYGSSLCTELSYYNWVEMNCRKYCARCS